MEESFTVSLPDAALRLTLTAKGVASVCFRPEGPPDPPQSDAARAAALQLGEYFAGRRPALNVPVDLSACSPFQRRVLEECARVPAGETITYTQLARRIGRPRAVRAVGTALARNPVPILIPCHRVLRTDGGLGGFIAGLEWKRRLLRLEGVSV